MPGSHRPGPRAGVEIAVFTPDVPAVFAQAVAAGAEVLAEPKAMPQGPTVADLGGIEGKNIELAIHANVRTGWMRRRTGDRANPPRGHVPAVVLLTAAILDPNSPPLNGTRGAAQETAFFSKMLFF